MIEHIQYFPKGTVYRIRNRKTKKDLTLSSKLEIKLEKTSEKPEQLWVVNEIKNGEYQVVQIKTGTVLAQKKGDKHFDTKIAKRNMKDNQLWNFIFAESVQGVNYFWIRPCDYQYEWFCASALDNKTRISTIDHTLGICLWEFVPYKQTDQLLAMLSTIRSDTSQLVLEVPQYACKEGIGIVQYLYTGGGNQRWLLEPYEEETGHKQYSIRNYCSGLTLTAVFAKGTFKVVQSVFNSSPDQRWKFIAGKDEKYLIISVQYSEYYLGYNNNKGGSPVSLTQDLLKSQWVIEGFWPGSVAGKA